MLAIAHYAIVLTNFMTRIIWQALVGRPNSDQLERVGISPTLALVVILLFWYSDILRESEI